MSRRLRFLLGALLLLAAAPVFASDTIRCGSRLIAVEARAADILVACGEPDFRDVFSYPGYPNGNIISDEEQWTYNFGSNQLLRVLKIRNGTLIDIETDGYGFPKSGIGHCDSSQIVEGLTKYRLLSACGEPLTRRNVGYVPSLQHRRGHGGSHGSTYQTEVYREEWVFNLGSRNFLKVVTLENGVVADVQNGDRGYDPH